MQYEQSKIVEALTKVNDPQANKSLILMNRVRDLKIEGEQISFSLEMPGMSAEMKSALNFACISAVQKVYPNADVHVHMVQSTEQAKQNNSPLAHIKNIIAVASGKGGVGKSTVAVNLALELKQQGAQVGLIDADLYGPSIPTMLGLQGQRPKVQEFDGKAKMLPLNAHGLPVMSIGFIIEPEQAVVLRGPRLSAIIRQFFNDCVWPPLDYMIVDLPPGTGDIQLTLVQTVPVTGAVMVTTPQEVAVIDAVKAMNMFLLPSVDVPILGVVENMSWFTPKELPENKYFLFGQGGGDQLAKKAGSVLLGQIPLVEDIRQAGDAGRPAGDFSDDAITQEAFKQLAENVARQVARRNEQRNPTRVVNVEKG